jgi:hypothetical protein
LFARRSARMHLTHKPEGTMNSRNHAWTLGVVLAIGVVLGIGVVDLSAQMNDPRIGTWKLDVAKSKYSPGPAPQSVMVKVEAAGQGEKTTTDFVNADGTRTTTQYTANFDGKDSPLAGSQFGADMVSLKRIDARTTERSDKKGDKVVQVLTRVVSQDGKTMTVTTKGMNTQGQAVNNVGVFDKQ